MSGNQSTEHKNIERDRSMRVAGSFGAIVSIAKELTLSYPEDQELLRIRKDIQELALKGFMRAWEVADDSSTTHNDIDLYHHAESSFEVPI